MQLQAGQVGHEEMDGELVAVGPRDTQGTRDLRRSSAGHLRAVRMWRLLRARRCVSCPQPRLLWPLCPHGPAQTPTVPIGTGPLRIHADPHRPRRPHGFRSLPVPPAPPGPPAGPLVSHLVPRPPFPPARGPPGTRLRSFVGRGRGQGTHSHTALRSIPPFLSAFQTPAPSTCPLARCVMLSCENRVGTLTRGVIYKYVIIY